MKTLILIASLMSSEMAYQEIHANDPGYSIHNYKHPNKAKAVAKRDTNRGVRVSFYDTYRDYKKPSIKSKENVLQIFRNTDDKDYLKRKNYKMPNG
jgi:hypothetical protein